MPQLFDQPFDANTVKPNEAFEALPAGWYNARVVASEAKPTKDNLSGYLEFELEIIDGEHKGRKVFDRLHLWNQGANAEKTREIAHRQLSAYCHATGVFLLQASEQLHGIPLKIKLAIRTQDGYEPSNDVKAVKHIQDGAPVTSSSAPTPTSSQQFPGVPSPQNSPFPPASAPFSPPALPATAPALPPAAQPFPQQARATPWAPPASAPVTPPAAGSSPWRK